MPDFQALPPWVNGAVFLACAGLVWVAGARLVAALDRIATITGIGQAFIGMVVTAIYLAGLIERSDRSLLRLGYDSWAVLATYCGGVVALYFLRGA
ncbi:hypothetical protein [Magnetospirillum sp. UT-4]|uniref:hypothetical protein n=1 Tax=Magnetospirillum sp. UT-4 TaxID=2681467 RepID=UPI0013858BA7|nr:hypothetical protein [Magnetospirillum sp. UT-4]CAA7612903.1 membrane hypothetical protein [Magnetospirillum sp. UT-4]